MTINIGLFIFENMQLLDMVGPYEAFKSISDIDVQLIGETMQPIMTTNQISISPTCQITTADQCDVLCIPGGNGVNELINNRFVLDFINLQAQKAKYVTSVCTGALVLGAAGLLKGRKATTHWTALDFLPMFGATPCKDRVVIDGNIITAGGITAGLDFGLFLISELLGKQKAEIAQLELQYDPHPPFDSGTPDEAPAKLVHQILSEIDFEPRKKIINLWKQNHSNNA